MPDPITLVNASELKPGVSFISSSQSLVSQPQAQQQSQQVVQQIGEWSNLNGESYSLQVSEAQISNPTTWVHQMSNSSSQSVSSSSENNPVTVEQRTLTYEQRPLSLASMGQTQSIQARMYLPSTTTFVQTQPMVTQQTQPIITHSQPVVTRHIQPIMQPVITHSQPVITHSQPVITHSQPVITHSQPVITEHVVEQFPVR
jgi:hypothetical protein